MRHRKKNRKFGRIASQRAALLKNLASSLIEHGRIKTTNAKAKELRKFIEAAISTGLVGGISGKRSTYTALSKAAAAKVINELGPSFASRPGGYTRIIRLGRRKSDAAPMALIELVK